MSIASEITRLQTAKADLKTAIEGKGVTVAASATLDDYADLVDAIETGGGGGLDWADVTEITVGANNVTNTSDANAYFSNYTYNYLVLTSAPTEQNQIVCGAGLPQSNGMTQITRYRNGALGGAGVSTNHDGVLVEGTKYCLLSLK